MNRYLLFTSESKFKTSSIVLLIGLVVRLLVFILLPATDDFGRYANSGTWYVSALTEHFADYISFSSNIPPATFLIQAAVFKIFGGAYAIDHRVLLALVFVLDLFAVQLLYSSAKRLGAGRRISFFVLLLLSLALVPFEIWRDGMHYDHYTFFFTSVFAWSLVRIITQPHRFINAVWLALAGGLLVSQSAVNAAIVPLSVLLITGCVYIARKKYLQWLITVSIALLVPVAVLMVIGLKNKRESQETLTSNKAGPAMLMVVQRAYRFDSVKVRQLMVDERVPGWYLWTYDHATPPAQSVNWLNLAQAFGICFYSSTGAGKGPWRFDFDPLHRYLSANGPQQLVKIVEADAFDAVNRPYRFAGFAPEFGPRWIGVYGDVSKKLFFAALLKHPSGMLKAFFEQQAVFALYGPLFPFNTTQSERSMLAHAGLRTEKEALPLQPFLVFVTILFAALAWVTYLVMLVNIAITVIKVVARFFKGERKWSINPFFLLSTPAVCIAIVFSCLVGGENDRYFMQLLPYLVLLPCCVHRGFQKKIFS